MPDLLLFCPLQHENARKTREEYVKLQHDITRALLCLTKWPHLHELFVVLSACGVADNAQEDTPIAIRISSARAVCPTAAESCCYKGVHSACLCVERSLVLWASPACSRPGPQDDWGTLRDVTLEDAGACACSCAGSKDDLEDPSKSTLQDYLKRVNETQREGKSLTCPAADNAGPAERPNPSVQLPSLGTRATQPLPLLACWPVLLPQWHLLNWPHAAAKPLACMCNFPR